MIVLLMLFYNLTVRKQIYAKMSNPHHPPPLKAGDDLEFLPPGKIGGVQSPSLAVLLIRTAVN